MNEFIEQLVQKLRVLGYSQATQRLYGDHLKLFCRFFGVAPDTLTEEAIYKYQVFLTTQKQVSWSYFNQAVCALRFFYNKVLDKGWSVNHIPFQKKDIACLLS